MWSSGTQDGGEELLLELDGEHPLGAVVLDVGSCPFGFPRDLGIETSHDGFSWTSVWRGRTAVATVRAALDDPGNVPISIQIGPVQGRFVRLRQLGHDPTDPWCVAELSIHQPS